jgi:hypothetical protein
MLDPVSFPSSVCVCVGVGVCVGGGYLTKMTLAELIVVL